MTRHSSGLTAYGIFRSISCHKPVRYPALARRPFSFRTVNVGHDVEKHLEYLAISSYGQLPALRHHGPISVRFILDYLARTTGPTEPHRRTGASGSP